MIAAQGILTSRGGKTSHAAVVARGMGKTCVCGAEELEVDLKGRQVHRPRRRRSSTRATSSPSTAPPAGSTSARCRCSRPRWCSTSRARSSRRLRPAGRGRAPALDARRRGAPAAACGPTPTPGGLRAGPPVRRRRGSGCAGPSTCSSATGAQLVERPDPGRADDERQAALDALQPLQQEDFVGIFAAMDGLPVTVRLIDPPLHEFLPDLTELSVAGRGRRGQRRGPGPGRDAAGGRAPAARGKPDARPARGAARPGHPRPVRDAGQGDRRGRGGAERRPAATRSRRS